MGIFQRLSDITRSNINALLDKCEDPAKMVDQMLVDMREKLAECKKHTSEVMAAEAQAKRALDDCQETVRKYGDVARKAVAAGNDADARSALEKKQKAEARLAGLQSGYDAAKANADAAKAAYQELLDNVNDLESRKAGIKAKMATAKAQDKVNQITSGTAAAAGASMEAFDRMEAKADAALDKAMAARDLNKSGSAGDDLLKKYGGGSSASVDDELAKLKAELGQ